MNLANTSAFTVTVGDLVTGASVTVTAMDNRNNPVSATTTATGATWTPALNLSSTSGLIDGAITIIATASETGKDPATSTQATVTRDTAPPTIAITGDTAVTVGDTISLTLTLSDAASGSGLTADEVTASAGGTLTNFNGNGNNNGSGPSYTVDFTAGNAPTTVTLTVAANAFADEAGNPNTEDNAFIITINDILRTLNIAASTSSITEGDPAGESVYARFIVSVNPVPLVDITVGLRTAEVGGNYLDPGLLPPASVVIAANSRSVVYSVRIHNDNVDEVNAAISVTLLEGAVNSRIATRFALVSIRDNDGPVISLSPAAVTVTEGEVATLTVSLSDSPIETTQVRIRSIAGSGNNGAVATTGQTAGDYASIDRVLTFSAGISRLTQQVSLLTRDDNEVEPAETLNVRLMNPSNDATLAVNNATATVTIDDNDRVLSPVILPSANTTAQGAVLLNNLRNFAITGTAQEGALISATVTGIPVRISAGVVREGTGAGTDTGAGAGTGTGTGTATATGAGATTGSGTGTGIVVSTAAPASTGLAGRVSSRHACSVTRPSCTDTADENGQWAVLADLTGFADGNIHITMTASMFGMESAPVSFTVLKDTSGPTVTIAAPASLGLAQYTTLGVTLSEYSTTFTRDDLRVSTGTLTDFAGSGTSYTTRFIAPARAGSAVISVAAAAFTDLPGNPNQAGAAHTIRVEPQGIEVAIVLASGATAITEGETAVFELSLVPAPAGTLLVALAISQVGDFIVAGTDLSPELPASDGGVLVTVATEDNNVATEDGTLTVTVQAGAGYTVASPGYASITVLDNDDRAAIAEVSEKILSRLAMALTDEAASTISDRVETAFSPKQPTGLKVQGGSLAQLIAGLARKVPTNGSRPPFILPSGLPLNTGALSANNNGTETGSFGASYLAATTIGVTAGAWNNLQFTPGDFAFTTSVNSPQADPAATHSFWGRGFLRDLSVAEGTLEFNGPIKGAMLGYDWRRDQLLVGIGVLGSVAEFDVDNADSTGVYQTATRGIHPYAAWRFDNGALLWGSAGASRGTLNVKAAHNNSRYRDDFYMQSVAFGSYRPLTAIGGVQLGGANKKAGPEAGAGAGLQLGLIIDVMLTQLQEDRAGGVDVAASRARLGLEIKNQHSTASGTRISRYAKLSYRYDVGEVSDGGGMELAGGLNLSTVGGLRLDLSGRTLLINDALQDWGISASLSYTQNRNRNTGFSVKLTPTWGITDSQVGEFWQAGEMDYSRHGNGYAASRIGGHTNSLSAAASYAVELKYGLSLDAIHSASLLAAPGLNGTDNSSGAHGSAAANATEAGREQLLNFYALGNFGQYTKDLTLGADLSVYIGRATLKLYVSNRSGQEGEQATLGATLGLNQYLSAGYQAVLARSQRIVATDGHSAPGLLQSVNAAWSPLSADNNLVRFHSAADLLRQPTQGFALPGVPTPDNNTGDDRFYLRYQRRF